MPLREEKLGLLSPSVFEIISAAGKRLSERRGSVKRVSTNRKDFVTNADEFSHDFIVRGLKNLTPDVEVYSEEDGFEMVETDKLMWVVDPLDGTINYYHGLAEWGVSIALIQDQQTELAAVVLPAQRGVYVLTRKSEQYLHRVREDKDLSQAQIWTDHIKGSADLVVNIFAKLARYTLCPQVRLCCTASMIAVATGKISGYVHPAPKPEDFAAAALIVEKCGGRVTDIQGNPWTPFSKSIVATNGLLHDPLLEVLNS